MGWGLSSGVIGWWPFWCAFVPWAAWLAWHDLTSRRLPDHLTLPAGAVAGLFSLYDGSSTAFALGAATWAGAYGAVGVVKREPKWVPRPNRPGDPDRRVPSRP